MSRRLRTVQTWAKHCGNPGALDVSSRWYSCVAAHVIVGDRPLRGVAEILSTHFLLIDDDGEVIFDAEISEVISVQRRQEVAVGETMSLGGDTPPIIRTCIELVVRSRGVGGFAPRRKRSVRRGGGGGEGQGHSPTHQGEDNAYLTEESGDDERDTDYSCDNAHNNTNNSNKGLSSKGGEHGGKYLSHEGNRLISEADAEAGDSAFDHDASHSKSPRRDNINNGFADDSGGARSSGAVPITFILEGPEGAHFAAGMELLWRRKFRMLSLRDQAMCRCSHISDFIYTISMLPLDVDCVLLQEQFPPNWRPNLGAVGGDALASSAFFGGSQNGGGSASSPYGGGGGAAAGASSSPYSSSTGVTITRDKSAVLRIDQNYVLRIIPRPDSLYESLTAGGLGAGGARASASSNNNNNNNTSFFNKTTSSFVGNGPSSPLASKSTFGGTNPAATTPTSPQQTQYQQWVFHLSDVLLITHSDNQLRIVVSDGRVLVLGSVDTRTVSGSSEQRSVTAGNDGVNSASGIGGSSSGQGGGGGGGGSSSGNASALSASNLALERRKAEAAATKAATGIDIAAMTAGSRNILDIFLFFSSTSCYQQLYLAARGVTKPNVSLRTNAAASGGNAFDSPDLETEATARLMPPVVPPEACFTSNDLYRVYHHYCSVDVNSDGTLSPVELFSAIGPVLVDNEGALPQALLKTFDVCKKGSIQLAEYFYGSRVLLRGTVRDRLLYLFALFDTESKGTIVLSEFTAGMRLLTALTAHTRTANRLSASGTISRLVPFAGGIGVKRGSIAPQIIPNSTGAFVVAGLGGTPESLDAFAKELFMMIDTNKNGEIDVEEFCKAMTMNPTVINALKRISSVDETAAAAAASSDKGNNSNEADSVAKNNTSRPGMPAVIYSAKLENASNPNTIVTFGHPRWREMVQIIAGIEHACRHPEALRVVDQKSSFSVKVPHDCSAWGNHALAGEVALRAMRNQQLQQQQLRAAAGGATAANFQQVLNNPPSAVLASSGSGGSNESITFNDYCPAVFNTIRRSFGLSNEEYLQSVGISQLRSGLLFGSISCLYEMISSGRSGSFFYSSHDNKFIMKTIPMSESVILRKMLPAYYEHVLKYPNTLLTRFCGLHALNRNGRKLIFVVMQNIFQNKVPVCETYDLKGSTVGRSTPMALRAPGVALKDNDFGARKIYMRSHIKRDLIKQIQVDSELLARHNLNDYSFLLGIHTSFDGPLDRRNSPPCDFPSHNKFQQFYGGIEGAALIDPATEAKGKESAAMNEVNALRVTADDDDWGVVETDHRSRAGIIPLALARHHSGAIGGSSPSSPVVSNGNGVVLDDFKSVPIVPTDPQRPLRYEIYFVGIIDMLTDYGVKKRGEHYSKSILYDSKQVSCIAPQEYVSRYIQYLDSIMVAID